MRYFVTGASSFLGRHLSEKFKKDDIVFGNHFSNPLNSAGIRSEKCDLRNNQDIRKQIIDFQPECVINIAAISAVAECETHPDNAENVNVLGAKYVSQACKECAARLIHVSTDMVFDGEKGGAYNEDDAVNPVTVYGRTKCEGEEQVHIEARDYVIVRPALIYGKEIGSRGGFLKWLKDRAMAGKKVNLFTDQFRTPVYVGDICDAILKLSLSRETGIFHVGGPERMTRVQMGELYLKVLGLSLDLIQPVRMKDIGVPYKIQKDLSLSSAKLLNETGLMLTKFSEGVTLSR